MLRGFWKKIAELLYPSFCVECKVLLVHGEIFCGPCYAQLPRVPLMYQKLSSGAFLTVHAASAYRGAAAALVQAKERYDFQSARKLGVLIALYCKEKSLSYDFIIPVPLHWSRSMMRGYNQATVMAEVLVVTAGGVVVQPFARGRATKKQRLLVGSARRHNVARAFRLKLCWTSERALALLEGKKVLLVDDVYTTGSTLKEFAAVVALCRPAVLDAIVACRVI